MIAFELTSLRKQTSTNVSTPQATSLRHKCVTELLKSNTQLMKRRVANFECRMAAISGSGAKHATSLLGRSGTCPTAFISGFSPQSILLARVCPSGASRCAADTNAVVD